MESEKSPDSRRGNNRHSQKHLPFPPAMRNERSILTSEISLRKDNALVPLSRRLPPSKHSVAADQDRRRKRVASASREDKM
ncbi:hypothetical protein AVEN_144184-1 [Araneus ventricosus]|uniref:Uncharacterized protein n=1 Tax=Araneus ventricosus TaxID=182803 RepID=A0A4Y2KXP1_ARAVE|nr:hypothetical protein AVEN_144184-1 [Araneus ventricosus]